MVNTKKSTFEKGDIVIYPRQGAGKITSVFTQNFNGNDVKYLDIKFFHSTIEISIPSNKAFELGLSKPESKAAILKTLKNLGKKVKLTPELLMEIDNLTKIKLKSGKVEDAIEIVNIIKSHSDKKKKLNKKISFTESKNLEAAAKFISSVVSTVIGPKVAEKLDLKVN